MTIVLLGESGCGKSSVTNELCKNYNYEKIVTYTTRLPREGEVNGKDYFFISNEEFNNLKEQGCFLETATYNNWQYGAPKNQFSIISDKNKIAILTPSGLRSLCRTRGIFYAFYLNVSRRERLIRILKRGDDIEESYRRNLSDVGMFDGIEKEVDYTINVESKNVQEIAKQISDYVNRIRGV